MTSALSYALWRCTTRAARAEAKATICLITACATSSKRQPRPSHGFRQVAQCQCEANGWRSAFPKARTDKDEAICEHFLMWCANYLWSFIAYCCRTARRFRISTDCISVPNISFHLVMQTLQTPRKNWWLYWKYNPSIKQDSLSTANYFSFIKY